MGGIGSGRAQKNGLPSELYRLDARWSQGHGFLVSGCTRGLQLRRDGGRRAQLWTKFDGWSRGCGPEVTIVTWWPTLARWPSP